MVRTYPRPYHGSYHRTIVCTTLRTFLSLYASSSVHLCSQWAGESLPWPEATALRLAEKDFMDARKDKTADKYAKADRAVKDFFNRHFHNHF